MTWMIWGTLISGGLQNLKSHLEMDDDSGYPHFRKPPCDEFGSIMEHPMLRSALEDCPSDARDDDL